MVLTGKTIKRLVIYFIYDKDGIVDNYICYMLNALKEISAEIAVVCNGALCQEGRQKLNGITPIVIERENKGMDVWAYKTILDYYGWDKLGTYDEIIMMNFTIMGPVYPLTEMFHCMDARDLDFWGITKFHKYEEGDPFGTIVYGYIPDHIQSHFIAVRNKMLTSAEFQSYWNNMCQIHNYRDAVGKHEAVFTKKFSDMGFTWDVYADMGEGYNAHPILCATKEMLTIKRCPIFKRRCFMHNYTNIITDTLGTNGMETMDFIDTHTDYDVNMIWDNILRLENQADIKNNLQLNYVLDAEHSKESSDIISKRKIALILHFYFEDLADYCLHYVKSMPAEADVYVTVQTEEKKKLIEKKFSILPNRVEVLLTQNRGRDVSAFLVAAKGFIMDYDYVCFLHDKKVVQESSQTVGTGFSYKCFENLIPTRHFVDNVLHTFDRNPRLGLLTPPPPNHGAYYITLGWEWGLNFEITKQLADRLGITVPISEDKEPIAPLGTMFWLRPKAMKLLFEQNWNYEDFPPEPNMVDGTLLHAIERIYPYVVQQEGYYPGWIFSNNGAKIEITNLNYMLRGINKEIFFHGSGAGNYELVLQKLNGAFNQWKTSTSAYELNKEKGTGSLLYFKADGTKETFLTCDPQKNSDPLERNTFLYSYAGLQNYGIITRFRWSPGEKAGITLTDILITVNTETGSVFKFKSKDIDFNGMKLKNELVFLTKSPQLYIKLPCKEIIKEITIVAEILDHIPYKTARTITAKAQKSTLLRSIRRRILG